LIDSEAPAATRCEIELSFPEHHRRAVFTLLGREKGPRPR
jgi:hypothetical protein